MSDEYFDKIYESATDGEKSDLDLLMRAEDACLKAYQKGYARQKLHDWTAAKEARERFVAMLAQKYLAAPPAYKHLTEAWQAITDDGWKLSKAKIYKDKESGLIRINPDGTVPASEVEAYITRAELKKIRSGDSGMDQLEGLSGEKLTAEVLKLKAQAEKAQFDLARERGKYLPKSEIRAELAAKLAAIEGGVKHLMRTKAADWISMAGGDAKKAHVVVEDFDARFDEMFLEFLDFQEIEIVLEWSDS